MVYKIEILQKNLKKKTVETQSITFAENDFAMLSN